jgi:phage gp45-like
MRANLKDIAHRAYTYMARGTLKKMDDKGLWPTLDIDMFKGESKTGIEWPQMYGVHSYPKSQDSGGDSGGGGASQQAADGGGGGDSGGGQGGGKAAEAMVLFLNGQRSHGVVLGIGDRRYRIKGTKEGEVAIYDDQKQQIHITRDGVHVSVPHGKKITHNIMKEQQSGQGQGQGGSGGGKTLAANGGGNGSGSGSGQTYGQEPWASKSDQIYSSHTHDKDGYVTKHPGKIEHHIVDENDHSKIKHSITIDKDGHIQHKAAKYTGTFSDSVNFNKA